MKYDGALSRCCARVSPNWLLALTNKREKNFFTRTFNFNDAAAGAHSDAAKQGTFFLRRAATIFLAARFQFLHCHRAWAAVRSPAYWKWAKVCPARHLYLGPNSAVKLGVCCCCTHREEACQPFPAAGKWMRGFIFYFMSGPNPTAVIYQLAGNVSY